MLVELTYACSMDVHTGFHGKKQDPNLEFFWRGDV